MCTDLWETCKRRLKTQFVMRPLQVDRSVLITVHTIMVSQALHSKNVNLKSRRNLTENFSVAYLFAV